MIRKPISIQNQSSVLISGNCGFFLTGSLKSPSMAPKKTIWPRNHKIHSKVVQTTIVHWSYVISKVIVQKKKSLHQGLHPLMIWMWSELLTIWILPCARYNLFSKCSSLKSSAQSTKNSVICQILPNFLGITNLKGLFHLI